MSSIAVHSCADFLSALFYEHGDGKITVYAVFHVAQSPDKWRERM